MQDDMYPIGMMLQNSLMARLRPKTLREFAGNRKRPPMLRTL